MNLKNNFGVGPRDWWWALHFLTLKIICCYNYNPHVVFDAITATNPYSSWGWKIVLGEFICPSLRPLGTDNYTFPAPFSVTGTFSPRNFRKFHVANVTKIYMTRTFAPGGRKFPGTFVPGSESSRELSPAGAKVPRMELSLQGAKVPRSESSIIPIFRPSGTENIIYEIT